MFYIFLAGAILGVAGTLYMLTLIKGKSNAKKDSTEGAILFLNFLLLNKENVVSDTVEAKLTSRFGNNSSTRFLASKLGKLAASRVPDSAVTDKIGDQVSALLPTKLLQMGITAECRIAFKRGPYLVALVRIQKVDANLVITKSAGKEKATKFDALMDLIGTPSVKDSVDSNFVQFIAGKLSTTLPIKLRDVLASKGLEVTIACTTEEQQAKYMFSMLESIDNASTASSAAAAEGVEAAPKDGSSTSSVASD